MSKDLMEKLMISKAIMQKSDTIKRGNVSESSYSEPRTINAPQLETFQPVAGNYNIPQEYIQESQVQKAPQMASKDRIVNSKLPDEIKRLMIENPIEQPSSMYGSSVISEEMVERAAKLMGTERPKQEQKRVVSESTSTGDLRQMLREVVEEVLRDNGIIAESSQKANETIMFKVGEHIFEGKVTKIKKVRKQ
jgi:hypothetical protein